MAFTTICTHTHTHDAITRLTTRFKSQTTQTNLVNARHNKRFLDEGDPGVGVQSQKLLHLFAVGYFWDGTQLLVERTQRCVYVQLPANVPFIPQIL